LDEDPYETTNLYDSSDEIKDVQSKLYDKLDEYLANKAAYTSGGSAMLDYCRSMWDETNSYVTPWDDAEADSTIIGRVYDISYPENCGLYSEKR
jgi:hypothetical protein